MKPGHPGVGEDLRVREARADAVEHLLGGADALRDSAVGPAPIEELALMKADALRDTAFAAGMRWAAALARERGLDRFSEALADEAEDIVGAKRVMAAVAAPTRPMASRTQEAVHG